MKKEYTFQLILGSVILALFIFVILKRKQIMEYANKVVWDYKSESKIDEMHPKAQPLFRAFINRVQKELGITMRLYSGYRSFNEQDDLFDKGRTPESIEAGERIVTKARAGRSGHNYGTDGDLVQIKDGKAIWRRYDDPVMIKIAEIGKKVGLKWGGDWSSFRDAPHFYLDMGKSWDELIAKIENNEVDSKGFINIT